MLTIGRNGGKINIRKSEIATLVLEDSEAICGEDVKEDTEAMLVDPITKSGYIIQKVRPRNTYKTPVIFKVLAMVLCPS